MIRCRNCGKFIICQSNRREFFNADKYQKLEMPEGKRLIAKEKLLKKFNNLYKLFPTIND